MTSSALLGSNDHAAGIARAAGQLDVEMYWISDGILFVEGVTQQQLDAAVAGYDHAVHVAAALERSLINTLNVHLDSVAGQRRYDNRFTCSLRAGFAGPFQAEGVAFAAWMDQCNMVGYTIMQEVKAGTRPVPSEEELIAAMPVIEWPPSPIPPGAISQEGA